MNSTFYETVNVVFPIIDIDGNMLGYGYDFVSNTQLQSFLGIEMDTGKMFAGCARLPVSP